MKEKYITADPSFASATCHAAWGEEGKKRRPTRRRMKGGDGGRSGKALKHRGDLITRVARSSFTYRGRYTLAYFKPAIFQHLRYTSTSNLHEPTIRTCSGQFSVSPHDAIRNVLSRPRRSTVRFITVFNRVQFTQLIIIILSSGLFIYR